MKERERVENIDVPRTTDESQLVRPAEDGELVR